MNCLRAQDSILVPTVLTYRLVAFSSPDNHENVEEEVDDVQVQVQAGKHVLLGGYCVLKKKYIYMNELL